MESVDNKDTEKMKLVMISELMGGVHPTTHVRKLKLDSCGKGSIRTETATQTY